MILHVASGHALHRAACIKVNEPTVRKHNAPLEACGHKILHYRSWVFASGVFVVVTETSLIVQFNAARFNSVVLI